MRRLMPVWVLGMVLTPLIGSTPAWASLNDGLLQLASGQADCRRQQYAQGVDKMLKAAVTIQQANPSHPANRRWLPQVRHCLRSWVLHTVSQCRRSGKATALSELLRIKKRIKYLSAPGVKRLITARFRPCAAQIVRLQSKECLENPGRAGLARLASLLAQLTALGVDKRTLGRLAVGRGKCAFQWVKESESRCKTNATVAILKEIGAGIVKMKGPQQAAARKAYEACAKALGTRGWQICQSRRFVQGRSLLAEAVTRYSFFRARDRRFLKTMRTRWLPRCGTYLLKGYFTARVRQGKVSYKLAAKVRVEVSRTGRGNTVIGELRAIYSAVNGVRRGCRVLITPRDGRYSLTGSHNPTAKQMTIMREKGMVPTEAMEGIQVTCGEQAPDLFKTRFVHALLEKSGIFSIAASTRPGTTKRFAYQGAVESGKGSIAGTLTLHRIQ